MVVGRWPRTFSPSQAPVMATGTSILDKISKVIRPVSQRLVNRSPAMDQRPAVGCQGYVCPEHCLSITLHARIATRRAGGVRERFWPLTSALIVALPLAVLLCWHSAVDVWRTGDFANTDDATRAVQIRDWMAGQGWFDLTMHRLGSPLGLMSHWSRVVDVPVAALIRVFGLSLPSNLAERAARIAFSFLLQSSLIAAMAYAARILAGPRSSICAGLLIVAGLVGAFQFEPGRIHHHAPQILLLTLAVAALLDSLDPARARRAAVAGLMVSLSLMIGMENLPFFAILLVVLPLAWAIEGDRYRRALLWSSAGLGIGAAVLFICLVPPERYGAVTVDAFSLVHLVAIEGGSVLCIGAAALGPRLATRAARLSLLVGGSAVLAAVLAVGFPEGLHGPYDGIDPLLRSFWLDEVSEARPLVRFLHADPFASAIILGPIFAGCAAAIVAALRSSGLARTRWLVLLALLAVGILGSCWEIRMAFSLQPLALLGGAWALSQALRIAERDGRLLSLWLPVSAFCLFSSLAWGALPWPNPPREEAGASCFAARSAEPLAALGSGIVFAPIDAGPYLLAHTALSVLAGPYHRDIAGLHAVIEGFLASSAEARVAVVSTGARFLAVCGQQTDLEIRAAPSGLAASIARGDIPPWLEPLALGDTPYKVYAVH